MIVGSYTIDPKRIVSADYELRYIANAVPIYEFSIRYLIANQLDNMTQLGTLEDCIKWSKQVNKYIGKDALLDAISTRELDQEEDIEDEDAPEGKRRPIGFNPGN